METEITQHERANWASIVQTVRSRQRRAAVLDAQRRAAAAGAVADAAAMRAEYWRILASGKYVHLDRLPLSASHLAELAIVYQAAARGVSANRLEGKVRAYLTRHHLITPVPGSAYPADDWRSHVVVTAAGAACVQAAMGEPVTLTLDEAVPLAVIARSGTSGTPGWPGTELSLRVATVWRLVEVTHPNSGGAVYHLTPAGQEALARQRSSTAVRTPESITTPEFQMLTEVKRVRNGDLGVLLLPRQRVLQRCLDAGWLVEREAEPGSRPTYAVTEDGEDAVSTRKATERKARPVPPVLPTVGPTELQEGMWIRLMHRKTRGVTAAYVKVKEVQTRTVSRSRPVYEVWVTDPSRPEPYVYAGAPFHPNIRFQVQP